MYFLLSMTGLSQGLILIFSCQKTTYSLGAVGLFLHDKQLILIMNWSEWSKILLCPPTSTFNWHLVLIQICTCAVVIFSGQKEREIVFCPISYLSSTDCKFKMFDLYGSIWMLNQFLLLLYFFKMLYYWH